ncbi:Splicing factor, partial [Ascosphaera aggregata]
IKCGRMKSVKILPDSPSTDDVRKPAACAAVVEFETYEDALSALTRDQKLLDGNVVSVQSYVGATVYLTNFPPEKADDKSMRELFSPYGDIVDIRFPSLRYNPHRRFCYVQFASADAAHRAVAEKHGIQIAGLDGKVLQLHAQISDPMRKNERHDAGREGREVHVSNLVYTAEEKDLRELFESCGTIESVRVPKKVDGSGKGFGFVVFESPEAATTALSMENTVFRGREVHVRLSTAGGAKHSTTAIIQSQGNETRKMGKADVPPAARTIALMNVPDTVNDARIRAVAEMYGPLVKLTLRPDHAGAIIEFVHENDAGKSSLGLEGTTLDGQVIHVGSVREMLAQEPVVKGGTQQQAKTAPRKKSNEKNDKKGKDDIAKSVISQPAQAIRRPGRPANGAGRRGGLGIKRFSQHSATTTQPAPSDQTQTQTQSSNRSNDDFRAILEQAKSSQQKG